MSGKTEPKKSAWICRSVGCRNELSNEYPVDTHGMCPKCWNEQRALTEMKREKESRDAVQDSK